MFALCCYKATERRTEGNGSPVSGHHDRHHISTERCSGSRQVQDPETDPPG